MFGRNNAGNMCKEGPTLHPRRRQVGTIPGAVIGGVASSIPAMGHPKPWSQRLLDPSLRAKLLLASL